MAIGVVQDETGGYRGQMAVLVKPNGMLGKPVVDDENRLVGVVSQADIALEAKDKSVGEMVADISKPSQGSRQL